MRPADRGRRTLPALLPTLLLLLIPVEITAAPAHALPAALAGRGGAGADTARAGWNSPRVLGLVRRVAEARASTPVRDAAAEAATDAPAGAGEAAGEAAGEGAGESAEGPLQSFRARAEGHVYYLFDPGELPLEPGPGRRVARADQVALRIRWSATGGWQQEIVGRRSRTYLPVDLHYHLDHLLVVTDHFGDRIRMGEGTEVRDVPHPAATPSLERYDYRLDDSLSIRVATGRRRLYRVSFRPRDPEARAAVGEMYVDADAPAVVRMSFTFTPRTYRDPRVDHITVDLRSALVEGRLWLPALQETTVRRQLRWLRFPAGGTIRTRMEIRDYELDPGPPPRLAGEPRVLTRPDSALAAYEDWRRPLLGGPAGASSPEEVDLAKIRRRAREVALRSRLSGTAPLRLHLPDASHVARVRRAEGVLVGAGASYDDGPRLWTGWIGHAFGTDRPQIEAGFRQTLGEGALRLDGCYRCPEDVGPIPPAAGVSSSVAALVDGGDYTDPWFHTGGSLSLRLPAAGGHVSVGVSGGRIRAAEVVEGPWSTAEARPVRPVRPGEDARLELGASLPLGSALSTCWSARLAGEAATDAVGDFGYTRILGRLDGKGRTGSRPFRWEIRTVLGAAGGRLPAHRLFLLGGRGTLPGYAFRPWGGGRLAWLGIRGSVPVVEPWLTLRLRAAAGLVRADDPARASARAFGVGDSGGLRPSVGGGVGLFWDLLRVELLRGLDGGDWTVELSLDPDFWPVL